MKRLLPLLPLLAFLACDHSPLGFDQLERGIGIPTFLDPGTAEGSDRCYGKFNVNNSSGQANNLILGRNREYESRVLVRFSLADSAPRLDSVDSAQFVVHTRVYHPVPFNVYALNADWDEFQATWHDAQNGQPWFQPGGDFDPTRLIQSGTVAKETTIITLPKSVLDTLVRTDFGLILVPQPNDSGNFATLYSRVTSGDTPTVTYFYGKNRRTFEATQNTYIVDTLALDLGPGKLWLGSGYLFRSYLKFNLDTLRAESASTVITAALTVHPETAYSQRDTLEIGVHRLTESYEPSEQSAAFSSTVIAQNQYVAHHDTVVAIDLRPLVQFWTDHPDSNFGMLLTLEPENYDVSRVELKRGAFLPTLHIGYVRPPHGRF